MAKKIVKLTNGNYRSPATWAASFGKEGIASILHPRRWSNMAPLMKVGDRIVVARGKRPNPILLGVKSKTAKGVRVQRLA